MTKQELNHHLVMLQQLEKNCKFLVSLEAAGLVDEAANIRNGIGNLDTEVQQSAVTVAAWIDTIEDLPTRMIFRLRFLRGLEWKAVAALIDGGRPGAAVRDACLRYLKAHPEVSRD